MLLTEATVDARCCWSAVRRYFALGNAKRGRALAVRHPAPGPAIPLPQPAITLVRGAFCSSIEFRQKES